MKKVLMISYGFPPLLSPGAIRIGKFAKYLPHYGWQPYIITVSNDIDYKRDISLLKELPDTVKIFRTKTLHPYLYLGRNQFRETTSGAQANVGEEPRHYDAQPGVKIQILRNIRRFVQNWIFIPDNKVCWLPTAVMKGYSLIKRENIGVIFTSSPEHSIHLIGLILKKLCKVKWVADFRDAWITNPYAKWTDYKRKKIEMYLERQVIYNADVVSVVTELIKMDIQERFKKRSVTVICNGYDTEDFVSVVHQPSTSGVLVMTHTGTFVGLRSPKYLIQALSPLVKTGCNIKLVLVGQTYEDIPKLVNQHQLEENVTLIGQVEHATALKYLSESDVLLLITGSSSEMTSKIFEYLAIRKPILALASPESPVAELLRVTNAGVSVPPDDVHAITNAIKKYYTQFTNGRIQFEPNLSELEQYERKNLTKALAAIFGQLSARDNNQTDLRY